MKINLSLPDFSIVSVSTNRGEPSQITVTAETIKRIAEQVEENDLVTFSWQALQEPIRHEIYIERIKL